MKKVLPYLFLWIGLATTGSPAQCPDEIRLAAESLVLPQETWDPSVLRGIDFLPSFVDRLVAEPSVAGGMEFEVWVYGNRNGLHYVAVGLASRDLLETQMKDLNPTAYLLGIDSQSLFLGRDSRRSAISEVRLHFYEDASDLKDSERLQLRESVRENVFRALRGHLVADPRLAVAPAR